MRVPIKIKRSRKCKRCGLRYPEKDPLCPYCDGLGDDQLRKIRLRHRNEFAENTNLGRLLLSIAALLIVAMVIFLLNSD
jgi:DTW domain-containing protein YfiP